MKMPAYELHLIPPDLRREEAIHQIADSLDYVQKITDSIFKKILDRVTDYNKRLQSVCDRADIAQKKIDKIRGSSKATKVFSSCKYPGEENLDDYKPLFTIDHGLAGTQTTSYHVKSKHAAPDERTLKQKLQFYNVRVSEKQKEKNQMLEEGLGSLPRTLDSLSTLLLFNTSENPYKKYVVLDPLGAITKTRKSLEEEKSEEIGAAPLSISQRETMEAVEKINYFYNPGMGQVPEMDVPLALPDLPGVADDLLYSADVEPSIAPSSIPVITSSVLPELPTVVPEGPQDSPSIEIPPAPPSAPAAAQSVPHTATAAAPPPPPPPPLPPPPPPPPPAVSEAPTPTDEDSAEKKAKSPESLPPPSDARANLLESIRRAGGSGKAKLKSVQDRKIEAKKRKEEEKTVAASGGGDLMSDLFNKLQMRRKGISGANRTGSVSEGGVQPPPPPASINPSATLQKISAMIPPPPIPKPSEDQSEDNDDDDWD